MTKKKETVEDKLRRELAECRATLDAIRTGGVDAIVVQGPKGAQVFGLEGDDRSYRILVEAMNEGAATLDEEGTVLYCNLCFAAMVGRPLSAVMGASLRSFIAPGHEATFDALLKQGRRKDTKGAVVLVGEGREVPAYLAINSMRTDGSKQVLCLVATDLTDHVRNEEMVASERLARSVLEQAMEAIVVCDPDEQIVRASKAAHALCGGNPLLRPFSEVFPLHVDGERRSLASQAIRKEVVSGVPATLLRAGHTANLQVSAGPLLGARDQVLGCVVTLTDVTKAKRVETDLQAAISARDEFLSIASHELRTPLTALTLQLQSLQMLMAKAFGDGLNDRVAHKLQITIRQADQLTRLIDGLLDVSRITSGKLTQLAQELDLCALVRDVVERSRGAAERAGCVLDLRAPGKVIGNWDPTQLEQVLSNLVTNAIKYGAAKPITVGVDGLDGVARIRVRDQGIGIAEKDRARIFDRFERAVSPENYGGLGLGLFIARRIVQAYGGAIDVTSALGEGSEFIVTLPRGHA